MISLEQFTRELVAILPDQSETEQRIGIALHRRLARGAPVEVAVVAGDTGLTEQEVTDTLEKMAGVYRDDDGRVVGYVGLTIAEFGEHRVEVGGRALWAWCAWDTLFLPRTLEQTLKVSSRSPDGAAISLTSTPGGPRDVSPAEAVVSFVPVGSDFVKNTIAAFCHFVHFFPSSEAAAPWIAAHPGAFTLPVEDAYALGGVFVREVFGDVIPDRSS